MPYWRPSDWVVLGMKKPGNDVRVQEVRGLGPGMKWVPRVQDGVCWKASNICRVKSHVYRLALIRWPFTRPRPGFSADFVPEFRLARARCKQIPGATLGTLSTYVRSFCLTLLLCTCYLVKSRVICRQYPSHVHAKTFTRTFSLGIYGNNMRCCRGIPQGNRKFAIETLTGGKFDWDFSGV